jgi:hypothetical protein
MVGRTFAEEGGILRARFPLLPAIAPGTDSLANCQTARRDQPKRHGIPSRGCPHLNTAGIEPKPIARMTRRRADVDDVQLLGECVAAERVIDLRAIAQEEIGIEIEWVLG